MASGDQPDSVGNAQQSHYRYQVMFLGADVQTPALVCFDRSDKSREPEIYVAFDGHDFRKFPRDYALTHLFEHPKGVFKIGKTDREVTLKEYTAAGYEYRVYWDAEQLLAAPSEDLFVSFGRLFSKAQLPETFVSWGGSVERYYRTPVVALHPVETS